jgi:hypothetical protein
VFQQELQATEDKGEVRANDEGPSAQPSENPVPSDGTMVEEVENEANEDSVDEADDQLDDEIEDGDNNNKESNQNGGHDDDHVSSSLQLRRSSRIRGGIKKPSRYAMVAKKLRNKMIRSEELQSKGRRQAMEPVRKEEIPKEYIAHNTHCITIEKFTADGRHDKFKSRLVAHGNEQDAMIYADQSSPTVAIQSLMTRMMLAACNRDCIVGMLDVKGAFIQTEMSGIPVYIQCRGKLKDAILGILPYLGKYGGSDGILHCKLKKALYGCIQASKLWYKKLRKFLVRLGYKQSETDPWFFRKVVED